MQNFLSKKQLLVDAWWAGVKAVDGYHLVRSELFKPAYASTTKVLAIGKAASAMMLAACDSLGAEKGSVKGLCVTKYAHADQRLLDQSGIEVIEAAHPVPDENSLFAGQRCLALAQSCKSTDSLLVLLSGGASALAECLPPDIPLDKLKSVNENLLSKANSISQINQIRAQYSLIKNGQLLDQCQAGSIVTLAISDVANDDIKVIGSGVGYSSKLQFKSQIIGSNRVARSAIEEYFKNLNIDVIYNEESLYQGVPQCAQLMAEKITSGPNGAYIFGGEPTIDLPQNPGLGGRNQALALYLAKEIHQQGSITALVAGSDGSDGVTLAAGGIVDETTYGDSKAIDLSLAKADSGSYLRRCGGQFISDPTGTNVMDLAVVIKGLENELKISGQ